MEQKFTNINLNFDSITNLISHCYLFIIYLFIQSFFKTCLNLFLCQLLAKKSDP